MRMAFDLIIIFCWVLIFLGIVTKKYTPNRFFVAMMALILLLQIIGDFIERGGFE